MLQLTELGRLLWHERDALLQELAGLPPSQVDLAGSAHRFRVLVGHRWPSVAAAAALPGLRHPTANYRARAAGRGPRPPPAGPSWAVVGGRW